MTENVERSSSLPDFIEELPLAYGGNFETRKRRNSLPSINENNLDWVVGNIERSRSCNDLRERINYYNNVKLSSIEEIVDNSTTISEEEKDKLNNLINECHVKEKNFLRKLANISDSIIDINKYYCFNEKFLSDAEKIKYLRKITELKPKKIEKQERQDEIRIQEETRVELERQEEIIIQEEARIELANLEDSFFKNKKEKGRNFLNSCIFGNMDNFLDLINYFKSDDNENYSEISLETVSKGFKAACLCGNTDMVRCMLEQSELKSAILNESENFEYLKEIYCNKDTDIFKILIGDDDIRKRLVERENTSFNISTIFYCINDAAICPFDKIEEINTLFSYPEIANVIINNEYFKREFNGFFALGVKEIVEKVLSNDSIMKNIVEKYGILLYVEFAFKNKHLKIIKTMFKYDYVKKAISENGTLITEFRKAIYNNDFLKIKELLRNDRIIIELNRTKNFSGLLKENIESLNDLIFDKTKSHDEKINLREQKIDDIINILRQNRNQEKENILEELKNDIFIQIFEEAYRQNDTELIETLRNDEYIKFNDYIKEILATFSLEVIESLIKNNINFVENNNINNNRSVINLDEETFNNIKNNFKKICKKYNIVCDENKLFLNSINLTEKKYNYFINLNQINEKISEIKQEIDKKDKVLEVAKELVKKCKLTENPREMEGVTMELNDGIELLKDLNKHCKNPVNIRDNEQLCNLYIPAIKNSNNENVFKEGFGGITKISRNNIKIKFDKDGFLRQALENNSEIDESVLDILKKSLVIEHGEKWNEDKNSNKIELDTILLLFKKDPNIAFEMLLELEESGKINIKKEGFLFDKKLSLEEKTKLKNSFKHTVEVRKKIFNITTLKEEVLDIDYDSGEIRESIENIVNNIVDMGIRIIKCGKKEKLITSEIKEFSINNIIKVLSSLKEKVNNVKEDEEKLKLLLNNIKNANSKINEIGKYSNEYMIVALNNCIININGFIEQIDNNEASSLQVAQ